MLRPAYPIETARLRLRPYIDDDFDDLYEIQSRPEVVRFLYWGARGPAEVRRSLEERKRRSSLTGEGESLTLAVELPGGVSRPDEAPSAPRAGAARAQARTSPGDGSPVKLGKVIGDVLLLWISRSHRQGEIGYIFHPDYGGRGYATEAAEVMLRLGFDELGLHRIMGRLDARNGRSARVLERLGMRREAHLVQNEFVKGEWTDEVVYATLADEWRIRGTR